MLHIVGYGHENENDAILMESKEVEFLSKIGVKDPYKECQTNHRNRFFQI